MGREVKNMIMDLLFAGIIGGLEAVSDAIEFGPSEAFRINTSVCPEAERDCKRILRDIDKPNSKTNETLLLSPLLAMKADDKTQKISKSENISFEKKYETYMEESEEEMISKAVAEKSCW